MFFPTGTIINAAAVVAGGTMGMVVGARLPEGVRTIVFQGLGLSTLTIGMSMALKVNNPLVLIFSLLIGGIAGASIGLENRMAKTGEWVKKTTGMQGDRFTDGLLTAFLLFCVGSMTILGTMDEGLRGDATLLYTKSLLDGFAALALAATYGAGVLFSAVPLLIFQVGLTLLAGLAADFISDRMIGELTAVGGVLILGIGINLLEMARIRLGDLLPSLIVVVVLTVLLG